MALYIPHSVFHLALLLYVRPETFGPYYVRYRCIEIALGDQSDGAVARIGMVNMSGTYWLDDFVTCLTN
jgi:hypothetical protein